LDCNTPESCLLVFPPFSCSSLLFLFGSHLYLLFLAFSILHPNPSTPFLVLFLFGTPSACSPPPLRLHVGSLSHLSRILTLSFFVFWISKLLLSVCSDLMVLVFEAFQLLSPINFPLLGTLPYSPLLLSPILLFLRSF